MKKVKKIFSIFLIGLYLSQSISLPVFASEVASGNVWTPEQKVNYHIHNINNILADLIGIVIPNFSNRSIDEDLRKWIVNTDWIMENMTYDEWIANNLNIRYYNGDSGDAEVTFSEDYQNALKQFIQDWVNKNTGFTYGYSFGVADYLKNFNTQDKYHKFIDFVSNNSGNIVCCDKEGYRIWVIDSDNPVELVLVRFASIEAATVPKIKTYSGWKPISAKRYEWNNSTSSYELKYTTDETFWDYLYCRNSQKLPSTTSTSVYYLVQQNVTQYQIYNSIDSMKAGTEGVQEYYVSDSYNTTNVSGSYNTTTNNISKTITYSDVANYVNNYYIENTTYPSSQDVYNYINNYGDSGGGSGGGGGDSGGGGSDSPSWDFSFLGTIGKFIGDLIAGIGNIVSGILEGLTGLIDLFIGVENPETGEREGGLPNIIGKLIEHFLPFLPPEFINLFKLSLLLGLILGIVRLIRRG